MSSQVKKKAAEIDELIRRNAAEAKGTADDSIAPDSDSAIQDGDQPAQDDQVSAEVLPIDGGEQDSQPTDTAGDDKFASLEAQLTEAQRRADQADQRWRSLDGQLRSKDEQIDRLTDLVAKMTEAPPPAAEPPPPVGVTTADSDAFGDDMIDMVTRVARQVVEASVSDLKKSLEGLSTTVEGVSQHAAVAANESFESKLTRLSPRWSEFDRDEKFHEWLAESPTRGQMFAQGAKAKDAVGVAEFFNMYVSKVEAAEAAANAADGKKTDQLNRQVAPGKSRSTPTPASTVPTDKKQWTRTEIATAYSNQQRGAYTKEEWAALEAEMTAAQREERVDYSR